MDNEVSKFLSYSLQKLSSVNFDMYIEHIVRISSVLNNYVYFLFE